MNRRHRILCVLMVALVTVFSACDNGLEPPAERTGFGGTIRFTPGTWPSIDSLGQISLWVAASQVFPLDSTAIVGGLLASPPTIYLYPSLSVSLPKSVDSVAYEFSMPAATYRYVCVLQHYGAELTMTSFKVVGLYHQPADSTAPQTIVLAPGQFVPGVNIEVDFHHVPPQPF